MPPNVAFLLLDHALALCRFVFILIEPSRNAIFDFFCWSTGIWCPPWPPGPRPTVTLTQVRRGGGRDRGGQGLRLRVRVHQALRVLPRPQRQSPVCAPRSGPERGGGEGTLFFAPPSSVTPWGPLRAIRSLDGSKRHRQVAGGRSPPFPISPTAFELDPDHLIVIWNNQQIIHVGR